MWSTVRVGWDGGWEVWSTVRVGGGGGWEVWSTVRVGGKEVPDEYGISTGDDSATVGGEINLGDGLRVTYENLQEGERERERKGGMEGEGEEGGEGGGEREMERGGRKGRGLNPLMSLAGYSDCRPES